MTEQNPMVQTEGHDASRGDVAPKPTPSESWSWWWSTDEERYNGPHGSREQAVISAWGDGEHGLVHVMQATEGSYRCDLYDSDQLAEQFDEINYDLGDGDGDGPSASIPQSVWDNLAGTIKAKMRAAVLAHCPTSWAFNGQTAG